MKPRKNITAIWLSLQSTIVATVGVQLATPLRMSLVSTKVRTIVWIEVGHSRYLLIQ